MSSFFGRPAVQDAFQSLLEHPWWFLIRLVLTVCLATRGVTGLYARLQPQSNNTQVIQPVPRIPYWLPYLGHQLSFSIRSQAWLLGLSQIYKSDIFTLTLSGRKYHVVTSPKIFKHLCDPTTPVTTAPFSQRRSHRFFSNRPVDVSTTTRVAAALRAYENDNSRIGTLCKLLEINTYNLISPSKSWIDQAQWERNADVQVLTSSTKPSQLCVSASLPTLTREFSSHIILSTLLGSSFLESNPSFVNDLFEFGWKYSHFMTGLPYWITPGLGPPALAREKCLIALESLITALMVKVDEQVEHNPAGVGMLYDLESVHPSICNLVRQARQEYKNTGQEKRLSARASTRAIACEVLEVIWFVHFYATNLVVWMLLELFKKENGPLLRSVRQEVTSLLQVTKGDFTGLPFEDPPKLRFKRDEGKGTFVGERCPTLQAVLRETSRLRTWSEEYMQAYSDFVIEVDGAESGRDDTRSNQPKEVFQLRKGEHLYIARGVSGHDPRLWDQPERFDAGRFKLIKNSTPGSDIGKASSGQSLVTGVHNFQNGDEIAYIVAAIVSLYDLETLDGGGLNEPRSTIIAGMVVSRGAITVKISRRPL